MIVGTRKTSGNGWPSRGWIERGIEGKMALTFPQSNPSPEHFIPTDVACPRVGLRTIGKEKNTSVMRCYVCVIILKPSTVKTPHCSSIISLSQ